MLCQHFGICGGCSLQNLSPGEYRAAKRGLVTNALARAGLDAVLVAEPISVTQYSRRRAVFKLANSRGKIEVGFHAAKSHAIADMRECLVLTPALFELTKKLRMALPPILNEGEKAELHVTQSDTGLDLAFRWERKLTPALTSAIAGAFAGAGVARIVFKNDMLMENAAPAVTLAGVPVKLPPHAFLQATHQGETILQQKVVELMKGAKNIADLFAGLGTFTIALGRHAKIHAVEQDGAALAALAAAVRNASGIKPVTTEKRDLFKQPLTPSELKAFDAVLLDPPRAGAESQIRALCGSALRRIVYVSCDAATFARDAALLVQAGFQPGTVTPIDQFLYSGHIELVAGFERKKRR